MPARMHMHMQVLEEDHFADVDGAYSVRRYDLLRDTSGHSAGGDSAGDGSAAGGSAGAANWRIGDELLSSPLKVRHAGMGYMQAWDIYVGMGYICGHGICRHG